MIRFMTLTSIIEPAITRAEKLFEQGNQIDLANGGENCHIDNVLATLEKYVASKTFDPQIAVAPQNMQSFVQKLWDILWFFSSADKEQIKGLIKENKGVAKIKLQEKDRCKQLCLVKIVNETCKQTYGFELITTV